MLDMSLPDMLVLCDNAKAKTYEGNIVRRRKYVFVWKKIILHTALLFCIAGLYAENPTLERYIRKVHAHLIQTAISIEWDVPLQIVLSVDIKDSSLVNAYYYRDFTVFERFYRGYSRVTRGMLNFLRSEDELAAILSHELAHSITATKEDKDPQKHNEDELATYLLYRAGYNPYALRNILQRIAENPRYIKSPPAENHHFSIEGRVEALENYQNIWRWKQKPEKNPEEYRLHVSLLYKHQTLTTERFDELVASLSTIRTLLGRAENLRDKNKKFHIFMKILNDLSMLLKEYPKIRIFRKQEFCGSQKHFLAGKLSQIYPDWLTDKGIIEAKLHTLFLRVGELALSLSPVIGDGIDFYELVEGRGFFTDEELGTTSRILAGIGLIAGSRQLYQNVSDIAPKIIKDFPGISDEAKKVLRLSEDMVDVGRKIGFRQADEIKDHVSIIQRWRPSFKTIKIEDARDVNKAFFEAPYLEGTKVVEFETTVAETFVRVHGRDNVAGYWLMHEDDIRGLSAIEIAKKFNIPKVPTRLSKATIPKGTRIKTGVVGPNVFGNSRGSVQYEVKKLSGSKPIPDFWFELIEDL